MSSKVYNCAFCSENLPSATALREHFRSHAIFKTNGPINNDKISSQTKLSGAKLVSCDVCTETFDTVTKAISHKFKKHPDSPNNNFCPWCGKQFPIKHVRDSHVTAHKSGNCVEEVSCKECGTIFFNDEAVKYHSQSYHRKPHVFQFIKTLPPSNKIYFNGHSDILSVYYCHLCGQEYVIKYNLQKHISNIHGKDPITPPDDIVKCKTCDALFYSVKAYEFHNAFHKPDDLYVTSEEMRKHVVTKVDQDFDLRRVKPRYQRKHMMFLNPSDTSMLPTEQPDESTFRDEKPSSFKPSEANSHISSSGDTQIISKNAISLNQFVNMNKDIFSESVNSDKLNSKLKNDSTVVKKADGTLVKKSNSKPFDRVIDGPKVVLKRLALPQGVVKPVVKIMTKSELEKLKKQGLISVMAKPNPLMNKIQVVGHFKDEPKK